MVDYTDEEYERHLRHPIWTREETDHLVELCSQFALRWIVIDSRFDRGRFPTAVGKGIEDLKERYYDMCNAIAKVRNIFCCNTPVSFAIAFV